MSRKFLIVLLFMALLLELILSFGGIFAPAFILEQFKIAKTADTTFLAYTVGWLCLFVSLICILLIYQVWNRKRDYAALGYLLGFWWMGIGLGIYVAFKKTDNLLLDSVKGLLLVLLIYRAKADARRQKPGMQK